jgi:sugar/nucleoside kinase (ribokinase family)
MKIGRSIPPARPGVLDFTTVGEISLDTIVLGAQAAERQSKETVQSITDLPGGQAATAAVACRRLGWRCRWAGTIGDDEAGRRCLDHLASERVADYSVIRASASSRRAVILVDAKSGERRVFQYRDAQLDLAPGEIPDAIFTETRVLLVDATDARHAIHAARIARAAGIPTLADVDYVWPGLDDLLRWIDIVVMPGATLEAAAGTSGVGAALTKIGQASGALAVIATLGPDGALAWAGGREILVSAQPVEVVDTTGAGDAFRAGFVAGWLGRAGTDPDLSDLVADANLVAGLSCRAMGAQTSLPVALEVPAHLRGRV